MVLFHHGLVGTYLHQVSNGTAALSFGIALEELAHLEEQHHEDGFGKLGLSARQEADGQCPDGSYRHEQVLVEGIAVGQSLGSLLQCLVAGKEVGHEIDEEQLPGGEMSVMLDEGCRDERQRGRDDDGELAAQAPFFVFMVVFMMLMMLVAFVMVLMVLMM